MDTVDSNTEQTVHRPDVFARAHVPIPFVSFQTILIYHLVNSKAANEFVLFFARAAGKHTNDNKEKDSNEEKANIKHKHKCQINKCLVN